MNPNQRVCPPYLPIFSEEVSPSFPPPNPKYVGEKTYPHISNISGHPRMVGRIDNGDPLLRRSSRLQIESTGSVEAKDCTNPEITMKSHLLVNEERTYLRQLDKKEYPLASKMPPSSLFNFSFSTDRGFSPGNRDTVEDNTPPHSLPRPLARNSLKNKGSNFRTRTQQHKYRAIDSGLHKTDGKIESLSNITKTPVSGETTRYLADMSKSSSRTNAIIAKDTHPKSSAESSYEACKNFRQNHKTGIELRDGQSFPVTPKMSRLRLSIPLDDSRLKADSESKHLLSAREQDPFLNTVSTPPAAKSELDSNVTQVSNIGQYPTYSVSNVWATQKASLPSPGLSPIYSPNDIDYSSEDQVHSNGQTLDFWSSKSCLDKSELNEYTSAFGSQILSSHIPAHTLLEMQSIAKTFDSMPHDVKNLMMYQLLRHCSRRTLHVIADIVNPALKCDFLALLPLELSLNILSYLDHRDLCRSAQVSKQWRNIVDSNETGWKELFDRDGFLLPRGELKKAITQGWGWQDPYGTDGFEQDLSVPIQKLSNKNSSGDLRISPSHPDTQLCKGRALSKRKRVTNESERSKRRAIGHELGEKTQAMLSNYYHTAKFNKSEGPLTAANAAIVAVPDPRLGLPGLRRLHLFKSLYRRHYMLQHSWMSGKVAPYHFAFPAHTAHVITCLQFDDDKIITGSDDTLINIYDTQTGTLRKKLEGHEGGVWALQYEGNILVSGSTDRSVRVWDIERGLCTQVFHGHTSTVRCLLILLPQIIGKSEKGYEIKVPEKPLIITGSRDSQLRVWRLPEQGSKRYIQTGPPANDSDCPYFMRILSGHAHSVRAISAHQDTLVSGSYDNTVRVWKISTGQTIHRLIGHTMKVYSVVLDHKRERCISGSMDNFVKIWSIDTGACLYTLEGHSSLVGLLDLYDERLVSAAADSTLRIWDPENGQCKSTLSAHTGAITCFQHDSQKVISGSDRTLKLWNIKTGECVKDLLIDLSGVWQVKFDERRCVAAVQRDNLTYVEVLDFGASRDGVPAHKRGSRSLLSEQSEQVVIDGSGNA